MVERSPDAAVQCEDMRFSPGAHDLLVFAGGGAQTVARLGCHRRKEVLAPEAGLQGGEVTHLPVELEVALEEESCQDSRRDPRSSSCSPLVHQIKAGLDGTEQCQRMANRFTLNSKEAFQVQQYKKARKTFSNVAAQSRLITVSLPRLPELSSTSALSSPPQHVCEVHTPGVSRALTRGENLWLPPDAGQRLPLRCALCGRGFPHASNLKAHLRIHSGERPFCCSVCGRGFTKLSNLKAHRRVHTGEKPYSCSHCGKRFTQNCNLKRHHRVCDAGRGGNA